MAQPSGFSRFFLEPAIRLLARDLVDDEAVLRSLEAVRAEAAAHLALIEVGEALARSLPHREQALTLNHRLARRLVQAHLDWLDEVEQELGPRRGRRRGGD